MIFSKAYTVEYDWEWYDLEGDPGHLVRNVHYYILQYVNVPNEPPYWSATLTNYFGYTSSPYPTVGFVVVEQGRLTGDRVEIPKPLDPLMWKNESL